MKSIKKIGLFFGSFNPIHIGHLILANYILENSDMEELWFVVSPQNPFKEKILIQFSNYENQDLQFQIVDLNGRIIMENSNIAPQSSLSLGERISVGSYQFILRDKNIILQSQTILKI